MNTLKTLAMTVVVAASSTAPGFAAPGAHGVGVYAAGRSSFRSDSRSRFAGAAGGWGFAHADLGAEGRPQRGRRGRSFAYAYGGYPYAADYAYRAEQEPGPFGPWPPYGDGFTQGYRSGRESTAAALAPMAYGPGPHDGAYAYGYNGYAQTPPLPQVGPSGSWRAFPGERACGC